MRAPAEDDSFSAFPIENFLDLRLCQYGWEQCAPMHFFGPYVRSHYLFHYVISGRGHLDATGASGARRASAASSSRIFTIKRPSTAWSTITSGRSAWRSWRTCAS